MASQFDGIPYEEGDPLVLVSKRAGMRVGRSRVGTGRVGSGDVGPIGAQSVSAGTLTEAGADTIGATRLATRYMDLDGFEYPNVPKGKGRLALYFASFSSLDPPGAGVNVMDVQANGIVIATGMDVAALVGQDHEYVLKVDNVDIPGGPFRVGVKATAGHTFINDATLLAANTVPVSPGPPAAGRVASLILPSQGWISGAEGVGCDYGATAFDTYRGRRRDSMSTFVDDVPNTVGMYSVASGGPAYNESTRLIDIAICVVGSGETWAQAAAGAFDARNEAALILLRSLRGNGAWPTSARPAHEMNGNWYPWAVYSADVENFKTAMRRLAAIRDRVYPELMLHWCVNAESVGKDFPWTDLWVDGVWDAMSIDKYNQFPNITSEAEFNAHLLDTSTAGEPKGFEAHRLWALSKGLPLVVSEWSGNADTGDYPGWISGFYNWVTAHRGAGAGGVLWENQFNVDTPTHIWLLYGPGIARMPSSSATYASLWS